MRGFGEGRRYEEERRVAEAGEMREKVRRRS